MLTVRVDGVERVLHVLDDLRDIDKDRAVKSGLRSAGSVFKSAGMKNLRPRLLGASAKRGLYRSKGRTPGNLLSSFVVRVKKRKPGVLTGFTAKGAHAHLVDSGTGHRYYKGMSRGIMPANRFWRDTKTQNEGKAADALYISVKKAVERINNKL